ncbi:hypothetical protein JOQ06_009306 [Pogonophryne albipinna]|uniref:Transmembrane protein 255B n=1 Tax=Pogonophryne albipinna TaxID=1090488 RepID=A0AAD6BN23_9TELE|nr:hypothetical protein JOQ06_009306 [Pogonophryne albipinna]
MQQPEPQQTAQQTTEILDPAVHYLRYYSGITLSFGAFLGIVGIHLVENRRPMDTRPLQEDMCDFYASEAAYAYDNYYTEVTCRSFDKACKLKLRSNTCYCCYLYNCASTEFHNQYYEFTGVNSCWDVIHLQRLLWTAVVLNVFCLFLGIITAAVLGAYKDMQKPTPQTATSPAPPPNILYNPTQHMLTYAGYCPSGQTLPAYPNYPIPMQHNSSYQPPATPQMVPEGGNASTPCPSEENQSQPPSQTPNQPQPQGGTQEPGGYMLTPNAPVLYGSAYNPFEKPPPYAC